jgi:hypothetical protein
VPTDLGLFTRACSGEGKVSVFGHFGRRETGVGGVRVGNTSESPVLWGIELFGTCHGNSPDRIIAGRLIAVDLGASVVCRGGVQGLAGGGISRIGIDHRGAFRLGVIEPSQWALALTRGRFGICRRLLDGCLHEMVQRSEHSWLHKEPGVLLAIQRRGKLRCVFRGRRSGRRSK